AIEGASSSVRARGNAPPSPISEADPVSARARSPAGRTSMAGQYSRRPRDSISPGQGVTRRGKYGGDSRKPTRGGRSDQPRTMVSAAPRGGVVAAASDQHVTEAADCRAAGVPVGEGEGASLDDRERGALRRRGDGDSAARFLLERDAYLVARQVERLGEVGAD